MWAPWLEGVRLQSAGLLEEASREFRALLEPMDVALATDPIQASFMSTHLSMCYAEVGDVASLEAWQQLLTTYRDASYNMHKALPASPFSSFVDPPTLRSLRRLHMPASSPTVALEASAEASEKAAAAASAATTWPWLFGPQRWLLERLASTLPSDPASTRDELAGSQGEGVLQQICGELGLVMGLGPGIPMPTLPTLLQLQSVTALARKHGVTGGAWRAHDR